jgi:hypothetical protein
MTPVSMSRDIIKKNDPLLKAVMAEWLRLGLGKRKKAQPMEWRCEIS